MKALILVDLQNDFLPGGALPTVLDALQLGFTTHLIADGCRGVNLRVGDVERAIDEMRTAGVRVVQSTELISR